MTATSTTIDDHLSRLEAEATTALCDAQAKVLKYTLFATTVFPATATDPRTAAMLRAAGIGTDRLLRDVQRVRSIAKSLLRIREFSHELEAGEKLNTAKLLEARDNIEQLREQQPVLVEVASIVADFANE